MDALSETARLMVRPFRTYEALVAPGRSAKDPELAIGWAATRLLLVLGTLVALTSTGRFAPWELVTAAPSFAYVLVVQAVGVAAVVRFFARERSRAAFVRAYALYLAGQGPWLVALLAVAAGAVVLDTSLGSVLAFAPWFLLAVLVWGGVLTYACFRVGLGLGRGRTVAALVVFYVVVTACVLGYFIAAGQLLPILPGRS